jgi:Ala-tRNA(Pro) deacylase
VLLIARKEVAMILKKLVEFLDSHHIKYVNVTHSIAFTAQDVAQSAHISGKEMAKSVIVWMDGAMAMVVLPASSMVDFDKLRDASGAKSVELASESEFKDRFPECDIGAMPPFGNLFDIRTLVDKTLSEDKEIAFNAGSHRELIRMPYGDYERLVKPAVGSFAIGKK